MGVSGKDIDNEFNVEGIVDDLYKLRDEENNTDSDNPSLRGWRGFNDE